MSLYVTLSSDSSSKTYSTNSPSNFTTNLKNTLEIDSNYEVGLVEIHFSNSLSDCIYIYSDISQDQYVGEMYLPLLRTVHSYKPDGSISIIYDTPHYIQLKKTSFSTINIELKDCHNQYVHFSDLARVTLKLHFRKNGF